MRIGILAAMDEEINLAKNAMKIIKEEKALQTRFFLGKWNKSNVILVRSGVGKVNAATATQRIISLYNPNIMIVVGVSGACHSDLNVGDVVVANEVVQWDLDTRGLGFEVGEVPFLGIKVMKASQKLVSITRKVIKTARLEIVSDRKPKVFVGRIASGDTFVTDEKIIETIVKRFNNLCIDMESAAVAQVCVLSNIPFIIIKSVSDKANHQAGIDFSKFLKVAAMNSFIVLEKFLEEISNSMIKL